MIWLWVGLHVFVILMRVDKGEEYSKEKHDA